MKLLPPMACDFMVYKDNKNWLKIYLSSMWNQPQDSTPHLFSYQSSYRHPSRYIFEVPPIRVSSSHPTSAFGDTHADQWLAAFEVQLGTPYRPNISEPIIFSL